ncbi:MAG: hypothetical protein JWO58_764 [Chitinophagaceae bacterium]|nr:hypothetical protein [Chitinophagaceae bacterium]
MCSKNNSSTTIITEGLLESIPFSVPLFFRPQFVYRKGSENIYSFFLEHSSSGAKAVAFFSVVNHQAISLNASPFGSIYCNASCSVEALSDFIREIKDTFIRKGITSLLIKHYPACYDQYAHDMVLTALQKNGFEMTCTELNQYLPLEGNDKKKIFDHSKLHLIKKCKEAGFTVSVSSTFESEKWYDIIARARELRGHPMTIDRESLRSLTKGSPECYHFFEVKDGDKIISCAIGVQVTNDVLYYYLAADEDDYRNYSPMTFLLDRMFSFACEKNIKVLDMGISSSQGIVNEGLRWFKKSFGSLEQPKLVLECNIIPHHKES